MAKEKITLQMLGERMALNTGRSKSACEHFVRSFFSMLKEALQNDNIVKIKGFGTFKLVVVNARESVNISTGQRMSLPEHNKITFTPDKAMKDKVNRPFSQFASVALDSEELMIVEETQKDLDSAKAAPQTDEKKPKLTSKQSQPVNQEPLSTAPEPIEPKQPPTPQPEQQDIAPEDNSSDNNDIAAEDEKANNTNGVSITDDSPKAKKKRSLAWILWFLLILLFAVGGYTIGYMRVIPTPLLDSYSMDAKAQKPQSAKDAKLLSTKGNSKKSKGSVSKSKGAATVTEQAKPSPTNTENNINN